jgi:hypothetical protein
MYKNTPSSFLSDLSAHEQDWKLFPKFPHAPCSKHNMMHLLSSQDSDNAILRGTKGSTALMSPRQVQALQSLALSMG